MRTRRARRRSRGTIITIEIAAVVLLFGAVLAGVSYARERLDQMVNHLKEQVAVQAADRFGARLRVGNVAPSALRTLQVNDLELLSDAGDKIISARKMRVHYSLRTLLSTRSAIDSVNRVELMGVTADIQLPRDRVSVLAALGGISTLASGNIGREALPWPLVITDARVAITDGMNGLVLEDMSLRLEPELASDSDGIHLTDGRARLNATLANVAGHETELSTRIRLEGDFDPGQDRAGGVVQVAEVQTTLGTAPARVYQFEWDGSKFSLATSEGQEQSLLELDVELDPWSVQVDLQANQLRLTDFFRPTELLEDLLPWFDSTISGKAVVGFSAMDSVVYRADLELKVPSEAFAGLFEGPVDMTMIVQGNTRTADIASIVVNMVDGSAEFEGTIDIAAQRAAGRLTVTEMVGMFPVEVNTEMVLDVPESRMKIQGGVLKIGDVEFTGVQGDMTLKGERVNDTDDATPSFQVNLTGALPESPDGMTSLAGSINLSAQPDFVGWIGVEELNAGVLYRLLHPDDQYDPKNYDLAQGLVVSAQLEGAIGPDLLQLDMTAGSLVQVDGPLRAHFSAEASLDSLRVVDLDLTVSSWLQAAGNVELDSERLSFVGRVKIDDEEVPGTVRLETGEGVVVHGPHDLMLELWPDEKLKAEDILQLIIREDAGLAVPFRLGLVDFPLPGLSEQATADADITGTVLSPWTLLAGARSGLGLGFVTTDVDLEESSLIVRGLQIPEIPDQFELEFFYRDDAGVVVHGPHDLMLELWPGDKLKAEDIVQLITGEEGGFAVPFRLGLMDFPLPGLSEHSVADVNVAGTVLSPRTLLAGVSSGAGPDLSTAGVVLEESSLIVRELPIRKIPNRIELDFEYRDDLFVANRLRFIDEELDLVGSGVFKVPSWDEPRVYGEIHLESGQERYKATLDLTSDRLDLEVDVENARIDRLTGVPISGTASGRVKLTGSIEQPVIKVELTSHDVPLNEEYVTLALAGTHAGQRVIIDDLAVDYRGQQLRKVSGEIDIDSGNFLMEGRYEGEYLGQPVSMDLAVKGVTLSPADLAPGSVHLAETSLTVEASAVTVSDINKPSWDARIRWIDGGLTFFGGPLDGLSGALEPDGSFRIVAAAPLPLQGTASGKLTGNELSADLSIVSLDLTLLNDLIHTSAVKLLAGSGAGSVRIHGPINDPDVDGVVQATGVIVESSLIPQAVGPVSFPIVAVQKQLTLERTRPERKAEPVEISGTVQLEHWAPVAYDFSVQSVSEDGVPVDYRFGPIDVDGIALGEIRVRGDRDGTYITGKVEASTAQMFIDNANRSSTLSWQPLRVELEATTGRGVELTWPSEELPILAALVDVDQSVSINYDGFTGDYSVVGDMGIRRGDLFFFNRTFYLKDGLVSFAEDDSRFDPMVTVRAETRERTPEDGTLRIYLDAESPLSALGPGVVRLSSEPPRPLPELRAALGVPFGNSTTGEDVDLLVLASGMATRFGMLRPMERALRDSLNLDLFSIRSQLVENLLSTPLGVPRPDLFDNTTIIVGKYLGDDLFFEAAMRVQSETVSPVSELRTNLELSLEWATPFFLLEWSLLPSLTDPFQTDNSLSLSWRFAY